MVSEVWDGELWKDDFWHQYFSQKTHLGLQLNLDWFQPFKRTQHSAGAMYLGITFHCPCATSKLDEGERFDVC
jgi:hypothetical protein